jgi:hypothetical protein
VIASNLFLPYLLLDQNGNIYVAPLSANSGTTDITEEMPSASGYTQSTFSLNGRLGPMAIDGAGNFFVATSGTLYKETRSSNGYVEGTIDAGLSQLAVGDVAVDGNGNLYLATYSNVNFNSSYDLSIVMETPGPSGYSSSILFSGTVSCDSAFAFTSCGSYLVVDASGNIYVTANAQVLELSPVPGSYTSKWIAAGFSYVTGIAVDALGNIFIADQ